MVTFRPLSQDDGVYQSLIELEEGRLRILLDVGWNTLLDADLSHLVNITDNIDLILLTHATLSHLGAYCYLCHLYPEFGRIPTYATIPVVNMGRMVTIDSYRAKGIAGPFPKAVMSTNDIDDIMDRVKTVKYSQPMSISGRSQEISITAFNAGHSIGGTIWKIVDDLSTVIFAVDWNHSRDSHLNGAFLEPSGQINEQLVKPNVLVTSSYVSGGKSLKANRARLLEDVTTVISRGGSILLPTSAGSRVLELCTIIDKHLAQENIQVPLVLLSNVGKRILTYASSMLEYLQSAIIDEWQVRNDSPFETARILCVDTMEQANNIVGPKIVLATGEALETGLSKNAFQRFAEQPDSAVILTEYCQNRTLGKLVYDLWKENTGDKEMLKQFTLRIPQVHITEAVPLEGVQLAEYNQKIEEMQMEKNIQEALDRRNKEILETIESDSSDEEQDVQVVTGQVEMNRFLAGDGFHDLEIGQEKSRLYMFPHVQPKKRADDYGEQLASGQFEQLADEYGANGIDTDVKMEESDTMGLGPSNTWKEEQRAPPEPPLILRGADFDLKVLCSIDYIDFNGLTDMRSLNMILPQVQPSKLVVLPGNDNVIKSLLKLKLDTSIGNEDVTTQQLNHAISLKIDPELEKSLQWQRVLGRFSVAHVTGELEFSKDTDMQDVDKVPKPSYRQTEAVLKSIPGFHSYTQAPIWVGDIRLIELRKSLIAAGFQAEFRGQGVLVCNNKVTVRKLSEGNFHIEGGLEPEFYATRAAIRASLAAV